MDSKLKSCPNGHDDITDDMEIKKKTVQTTSSL